MDRGVNVHPKDKENTPKEDNTEGLHVVTSTGSSFPIVASVASMLSALFTFLTTGLCIQAIPKKCKDMSIVHPDRKVHNQAKTFACLAQEREALKQKKSRMKKAKIKASKKLQKLEEMQNETGWAAEDKTNPVLASEGKQPSKEEQSAKKNKPDTKTSLIIVIFIPSD